MTPVKHITLSELNTRINDCINKAFRKEAFWVVADVTNHTFRREKNYHHFELVEKAGANGILARISAKAWGEGSVRIAVFEKITGQVFTNNIHVLLNVSVEYHAVYGLQVNVNDIDTYFTLGVLEQQRQLTLLQLENDNPDFIQQVGEQYITANKKLSLPRVIQYVALISSATSAGAEDFKHTLQSNAFNYRFTIHEYHTVLQGGGNTKQFVDRIIDVFSSQQPYDVVVITRGGGAQTDFLIFDSYLVGKAIAKFPIPIITGIGHQKNETIADLMAHTATKTPTKAAEMIIAHNKAYEEMMMDLQKKVVIKSQQLLSGSLQFVSKINSRIVNISRSFINAHKDDLVHVNQVIINESKSILYQEKTRLVHVSAQMVSKPALIVYKRKHDLQTTLHNVKNFSALLLKSKGQHLGYYVSVINLMAPSNILKKGFAIVRQHDKIIVDANAVHAGSDIEVILSGAVLHTTVKHKTNYDGNEFNI